MKKKEFAATTLDLEDKAFVVYVVSIIQDLNIHPLWKAQIILLKANKAFISIPPEYVDFINVFLKDLVAELPKHFKINDYTIN